jgi:hypothetical protein
MKWLGPRTKRRVGMHIADEYPEPALSNLEPSLIQLAAFSLVREGCSRPTPQMIRIRAYELLFPIRTRNSLGG